MVLYYTWLAHTLGSLFTSNIIKLAGLDIRPPLEKKNVEKKTVGHGPSDHPIWPQCQTQGRLSAVNLHHPMAGFQWFLHGPIGPGMEWYARENLYIPYTSRYTIYHHIPVFFKSNQDWDFLLFFPASNNISSSMSLSGSIPKSTG